MTRLRLSPIKTVLLCILALVLAGCAAKSTGPLKLYPAGRGSDTYSREVNRWVFSGQGVRISVGHAGGAHDSAIARDLVEKEYVLLEMEIDNGSGLEVVFNPALVSLRDSTMDYKKPLDYTDFHDIAAESTGWDLSGVGKTFYDLTETVPPGERISKVLVFTPFAKRVTRAKLVIKNLYIGPETIDLQFSFTTRP
ncbi:MAG TPA: hypothetical protein VJM57_02695 [Thermodesulfobacteriota bacterium]|nr:hypothetical protein [Thermodesulfobacteriota bacterium]